MNDLLPTQLNDFQRKMYEHLITWKEKNITKDSGTFRGKSYAAILPEMYHDQMSHIHPSALKHLEEHRRKNPFRIHRHFHHMASSQAANINLFLPLLHHLQADAILGMLKQDFASLATDTLVHGYCIEYWGGNYERTDSDNGFLGDKSAQAGTDADIAIAYRNHEDELCLWLIEHKLTEKEFTECGGYKSIRKENNRRKKPTHDCGKTFAQLCEHKQACYYHDVRTYRYWKITEANKEFFVNHTMLSECPFKGGMNQLWRNQLLGFALESAGTFSHITFSVVRHADNTALDKTLESYRSLIGNSSKFSSFPSSDVIRAAEQYADDDLQQWIDWYKELYRI